VVGVVVYGGVWYGVVVVWWRRGGVAWCGVKVCVCGAWCGGGVAVLYTVPVHMICSSRSRPTEIVVHN